MARGRLGGGHALVFLLDLALFEEHLVLAPGLGVRGEQQDAGGHAVEAVHGDQVREAELVPEPDQRRFLDVRPAGRGGQEVRLVHDQQMIVLMQDVQLHRDPGLRRQGAVVPDEGVVLQRRGAVQGHPGLADDLPGVEPVLDTLGIDVPPAVHHVVQRRVPGPLVRQAQARCVDAVAHGEGGLHHRTILRVRPSRPRPRAVPLASRPSRLPPGLPAVLRHAWPAPALPPAHAPRRTSQFAGDMPVRCKRPATSRGCAQVLQSVRPASRPWPPAPPQRAEPPAPARRCPLSPAPARALPSSREACPFAVSVRRPRTLPATSRDGADEKKVLDK